MAELEAYYSIAPWSEERQDYRFAMLAMMIAAFGGAKRPNIEDYLVCPIRERKNQSLEEMAAQARLLASWFRGNHNRKLAGDIESG